MVRACLHCGGQFPTQYGGAMFCSRKHQYAAWRAVAMLRGTHGYINGQFVRL